MAEKDEKPDDLAQKYSRARLIEEGLQTLAQGAYAPAVNFFGAAIRKARRSGYWDIEAEYYRVVALAQEGKFSEAVQRCTLCLDGLHEVKKTYIDAPIPYDVIQFHLEMSLLRLMNRRGDGFLQLFSHLRSRSSGEFYLLKRAKPFTRAFGYARSAYTNPQLPEVQDLRSPLRAFSNFLVSLSIEGMEKGEQAKDKKAEKNPSAAGASDAAAGAVAAAEPVASGPPKPERLPASILEILQKPITDVSAAQELVVCQHIASAKVFVEFDPLVEFLAPATNKARLPYLRAVVQHAEKAMTAKKTVAVQQITSWINEARGGGHWF